MRHRIPLKLLLPGIAVFGLLAVPCFADEPSVKKSVGPDTHHAGGAEAPTVGLRLMGQSLCGGWSRCRWSRHAAIRAPEMMLSIA